MPFAIHLSINRESLLIVLNRFSLIANATPCQAYVVERLCHIRMFFPIHFFDDRLSLFVVSNSFLMFAKLIPCQADVVESCCHCRMPLAIHLSINRESLLIVLNRLSGIPTIVSNITQQVESPGNCSFAGFPQPFSDPQPVSDQVLSPLMISLLQMNFCNADQCPRNSQFISHPLCQFQNAVIAFRCFLILRPFPVEVTITEIKRY